MASDPPPPPNPSLTGAALSLGDRLIRVLPPAFVLLVILNCLFLGAIAWVFNHAAEARNVLLTKIVEQCLLQPHPHP